MEITSLATEKIVPGRFSASVTVFADMHTLHPIYNFSETCLSGQTLYKTKPVYQPFFAKVMHISRPIPREPPVTIATCPFNAIMTTRKTLMGRILRSLQAKLGETNFPRTNTNSKSGLFTRWWGCSAQRFVKPYNNVICDATL